MPLSRRPAPFDHPEWVFELKYDGFRSLAVIHAQSLETMVGRVRQVMKQTRIRIFAGDTKSPGKMVSVFQAHTEIIRKGKASQPNEFGKLVKIQEAENQIVTHFEVFAERPADSTLLLPSIQVHQQRLGRIPRAVAADAGFYSCENEKAGHALGVRGCRCPTRKQKVLSENFCSVSGGFVAGKSGELARRAELACLNEDMDCDVASIPVWTACAVGWGWA
jgi:hypothetical protein